MVWIFSVLQNILIVIDTKALLIVGYIITILHNYISIITMYGLTHIEHTFNNSYQLTSSSNLWWTLCCIGAMRKLWISFFWTEGAVRHTYKAKHNYMDIILAYKPYPEILLKKKSFLNLFQVWSLLVIIRTEWFVHGTEVMTKLHNNYIVDKHTHTHIHTYV